MPGFGQPKAAIQEIVFQTIRSPYDYFFFEGGAERLAQASYLLQFVVVVESVLTNVVVVVAESLFDEVLMALSSQPVQLLILLIVLGPTSPSITNPAND